MVGIVGTAISLLLAFRTGQAYDRWWEARNIWGAIVNESRTFIRQLQLFLPSEQQEEVKVFAERQIIWCFALADALRKKPFETNVSEYIKANNITDANIPNAILSLHQKQIKILAQKGLLTEFREVQLDSTVSKFCDAMGKCERIKNTIFPLSYGKLIHLCIYIFAFLLPFSLEPEHTFIKAILTASIPLLFLIIERTAIIMQDPFEGEPMDTPMTTISRTIEINLLQMVGKKAPMISENSKKYYYVL